MRVSMVLLLVLAVAALAAAFPPAQNRTSKPLDIYVIDVEGGNATLFVSPSGESLLIDTGNAGPAAARDAGRILAAIKDAGLQQIDHLIITHWHREHFGGLGELASHTTIRGFIDRGPDLTPAPGPAEVPRKKDPVPYSQANTT